MNDLDDSTQPSRGSMRRGSASDMKPAIANEINAMRRNIKQIHRGIIHPRTDKWIQYWDAVSFICLLFTACVTPVEVSLLESIPLVHLVLQPRHFALFITNRLVDSFFTVDLFLNFFIAYQEPTRGCCSRNTAAARTAATRSLHARARQRMGRSGASLRREEGGG